MNVRKRSGEVVAYDPHRIEVAVMQASREVLSTVPEDLAQRVAEAVTEELQRSGERIVDIASVQKVVVSILGTMHKEIATAYHDYASFRAMTRTQRVLSESLLTEEFISRYKHLPSPMTELGSFVYYRTYSRWLEEERRREYWWETCRRAVEYNCSLAPVSREEAEMMYDNMFHLRQFLSGRTLWVGGTEVAKKYSTSNFNCAGVVMNEVQAFHDLFYLLLVGSGVGIRVLPTDVAKLPRFRTDVEIDHLPYRPVPRNMRAQLTSMSFTSTGTSAIITVGDAKGGWCKALDFYLRILTDPEYQNVTAIDIIYDHVRPKGEKLKTFGGTASGHWSLQQMLEKITEIIKDDSKLPARKLQTIDVLDICNIIGENVAVGGVRRTAENILFDVNDTTIRNAKTSLYKDGKLNPEIAHRAMSNNSIFFESKPTLPTLHTIFKSIRYTGEPGFLNAEAARRRLPEMEMVNPCFEILLPNKGMCNLTTVNVFAFVVTQEDGTRRLDIEGLLRAQRISARAGMRMSLVELELHEWDQAKQSVRIVGCSLTGYQDAVNAMCMTIDEQRTLLVALRTVANDAAREYSQELGVDAPRLVTTVKPEGSLSQLPTVSSGIHHQHAEYFVRRVRINAHDPLLKVVEELGYPVHNEVGQEGDNVRTKVVEFPVHAPAGRTKENVGAIEQLENYKMFMDFYTDHNTSVTIYVKEHEWEDVAEWVHANWDTMIGISFLPASDSVYQLLPYEEISREEYMHRKESMRPFVPALISKYETEELLIDAGTEGCEAGVCPVR